MKKLLIVLCCVLTMAVLVACNNDPEIPGDDTDSDAVTSEVATDSESTTESAEDTAAVTEPKDTAADVTEPKDTDSKVTEPVDTKPVLKETPEIRTVDDLLAMKQGGTYTLMNDIDMKEADGSYREWLPIGTKAQPFEGSFDGNGYKITGFKITEGITYAGFFGYNTGRIQNLEVSDFKIDMNFDNFVVVGGLCGYNEGTIVNCYAVGDVKATVTMAEKNPPMRAEPSLHLGGLVGSNENAILNCYSAGTVTGICFTPALPHSATKIDPATNETSTNLSTIKAYLGGLVGENQSGARLSNSFAVNSFAADMTSDNVELRVGGLIGSGTSTNCYHSSEQTFSLLTKLYSDEEPRQPVTEATYNSGTTVSLAELQSEEFITANLWVVDSARWSFADDENPALPTLNRDYAADDFVEISTVEDLKKFQAADLCGNYRLMQDLDLGGETWTPVAYFFGLLDGNGHKITNFKLNPKDQAYTGLIAHNFGTVKNLKLEAFDISGEVFGDTSYIGAFVAYNHEGTVENCEASNTLATAEQAASGKITLTTPAKTVHVGSIVGYNDNGVISHCSASGLVSATDAAGSVYAGGIVGTNNGKVKNCASSCPVTLTCTGAFGYAGGLAGGNQVSIENSYATGDVSLIIDYSKNIACAYAGGLVAQNTGNLDACYATGAVTTSISATEFAHVRACGLVGEHDKGTISGCYALGDVSAVAEGDKAMNWVGGLIGIAKGGSVSKSFAAGNLASELSGSYSVAGGLFGASYCDRVERCYRYKGQTYTLHNTANDSSVDPSNTLGEEIETLERLQSQTFLMGSLMWSSSIWEFGTEEAPAWPTLVSAGADFSVFEAEGDLTE